jgi:YD repeat-containing protein
VRWVSFFNPAFNTTNISHDIYNYEDGNRLTTKSGADGNSTVGYGKDNQISTVTNSSQPNESYSFNALGIQTNWITDPLDKRQVLNDGKYQYQYDDEGNLTQKQELVTGKLTN